MSYYSKDYIENVVFICRIRNNIVRGRDYERTRDGVVAADGRAWFAERDTFNWDDLEVFLMNISSCHVVS